MPTSSGLAWSGWLCASGGKEWDDIVCLPPPLSKLLLLTIVELQWIRNQWKGGRWSSLTSTSRRWLCSLGLASGYFLSWIPVWDFQRLFCWAPVTLNFLLWIISSVPLAFALPYSRLGQESQWLQASCFPVEPYLVHRKCLHILCPCLVGQIKHSSNLCSTAKISGQPGSLALWFCRPETGTSPLCLSNSGRLVWSSTRDILKTLSYFPSVVYYDNFQICCEVEKTSSEHPYAYHLPLHFTMLILLHIYPFIHLFMYLPIHLIFDTFQNKLQTSVYFLVNTSICLLLTRVQYMFIFFRCKTYVQWNVHIKCIFIEFWEMLTPV